MSGDHGTEPRKKHRHDLGEEDHGPVFAAGPTKGIQIVLGLWIALTGALIVYAMLGIGAQSGDAAPTTPPAVTGSAPSGSAPSGSAPSGSAH